MATTSFTKNFTVSKRNATAFTKLMTEPAKPLLTDDFKSSFVNVKNNPQLNRELHEAINND